MEGNNPVGMAWEAIIVCFTKIKEKFIIHPWSVLDHQKKEKGIRKPKDFPCLLSNMKKYLNKLYI